MALFILIALTLVSLPVTASSAMITPLNSSSNMIANTRGVYYYYAPYDYYYPNYPGYYNYDPYYYTYPGIGITFGVGGGNWHHGHHHHHGW